MFPYTLVLLITLCISGSNDVVSFYYPSLIIWIVGLAIFAIPSFIFGILSYNNRHNDNIFTDYWKNLPEIINPLSLFIGIVFLLHLLRAFQSSPFAFGTDDFAIYVCGSGKWAHVRELTSPLLILLLYYVNKERLKLIPAIVLLLIPHIVYMVKGPILIALITAILLRLYSGTLKLSIRLAISLLLIAFGVFLLFYMVLPSFEDSDIDIDQERTVVVAKHFLHYLTSGILGYSMDLQNGTPDKTDAIYLITPWVNIVNFISRQGEMLSPISDFFVDTGLGETNVRTFFGAIDIRTTPIVFVIFVLICSTLTNALKFISLTHSNIFFTLVTFYFCSLLAMGWFEYYFWHLSIIEIPVWVFIISKIVQYQSNKSKLNEQKL